MASLTIELDEHTLRDLHARANEAGLALGAFVAALLAEQEVEAALDGWTPNAEDDAKVHEGLRQLDAGERTPHAQVVEKIHAHR